MTFGAFYETDFVNQNFKWREKKRTTGVVLCVIRLQRWQFPSSGCVWAAWM